LQKIENLFTGIIENTAQIVGIKANESNLTFTLTCPFVNQLKVDQSIAHNGVCLTVTEINLTENTYKVTAIEETLLRSNLADLKVNALINIERCLKLDSLLDGHLVQGHVDTTAICISVLEVGGSWKYFFEYNDNNKEGYITVEKGSVTVNGVSLTVVDSGSNSFSVAIIPYTYEHTNFKTLKAGDRVNIEFDIVGKYIAKLYAKTNSL
jgi:riboflavin synthase